MENPSFIVLSRHMSLRRQMDVIANNIANMNTTGFKGERVLFLEQDVEPKNSKGESLKMVLDYGTIRDTRQGPMIPTKNDLDVALQGQGYLAIQSPDGPRYTRSGSLQLSPERQIVDQNGFPVESADGGVITIPAEATQINITPDGVVATENGAIARLRTVRFEREQFLNPAGRGLYQTDEAPIEDTTTRVVQGMLEQSNVQGVMEMTNMIDVLRQYQSAQRIIDNEGDRQRSAVQRLARIS